MSLDGFTGTVVRKDVRNSVCVPVDVPALQDIVNAVRKMEARLSELERVCPAGMQKPKEAVPKVR